MGTIRTRPSRKRKADGSLVFKYTAVVRCKGVHRTKTFRTKTEAKDFIEQEEAKICREAEEGTLVRGNFTVNDAIKLYRKEVLRRSQMAGIIA